MRSVLDIIPQLIENIPESEEKLIKELNSYKNSLWNIAPELLITSYYWIPVANILNSNILAIDYDWKRKLISIFNDTLDLSSSSLKVEQVELRAS